MSVRLLRIAAVLVLALSTGADPCSAQTLSGGESPPSGGSAAAPNPGSQIASEIGQQGQEIVGQGSDMLFNMLMNRVGQKSYSEKKTKKIIDDRMNGPWQGTYNQVQGDVNNWMPDKAWDSAVRLAKDQLMNNFHGGVMGDVVKRYVDDSLDLIANFTTVNYDPIHTFVQMMIPPIPMPWPCGLHFQYPGFESGTCYWIIPTGNPICVGVWIESASLVDYYYPAYKLDVSEQMWQTAYLPNEILEMVIQILNQMIGQWAPYAAVQTIYFTYGQIKNDLKSAGIDMPDVPYITPDINGLRKMIEHVKEANRSEILHMNPSNKAGHNRNLFEPLNLLSLVVSHIPHVAKYHLWASDLPTAMYGLPGGYFYSQILTLSLTAATTEEWVQKIVKYLSSYIPGMPWLSGIKRCIANNKAFPEGDPKTPWDIDNDIKGYTDIIRAPPLRETGRALGIDICLDLVGEAFPFLDWRRLHITDATFQAAWKYLNLFHYLVPLELLMLDPQQFMQHLVDALIQTGIGMLPGEVQQMLGYLEQGSQIINTFQSMPFDQALVQTGDIVGGSFGVNVSGPVNSIGGGINAIQGGNVLAGGLQIGNTVAGQTGINLNSYTRPVQGIINTATGIVQAFQQANINNVVGEVNQLSSTLFGLNLSAWIAPRHSFIREIDRWYVLANERFRQDQENNGKQAKPLDHMTMINVALGEAGLKYNMANVKIPMSGSENVFEMWPLFKGCFHPGLKGVPPQFFIEKPRPVLPMPPIPWPLWAPSKIPGQLRMY